jgi:hypothetical protein
MFFGLCMKGLKLYHKKRFLLNWMNNFYNGGKESRKMFLKKGC